MKTKQPTNPVKAIRAKCVDCSTTSNEVELCTIGTCALHPFRFGRNPYRQPRKLTAAQKLAGAQRMAAARRNAVPC